MTTDLHHMTNDELKQYISQHRNDDQAFGAALEVLISRLDPNAYQPYPFDLANPEAEVEAIFRKKFNLPE